MQAILIEVISRFLLTVILLIGEYGSNMKDYSFN